MLIYQSTPSAIQGIFWPDLWIFSFVICNADFYFLGNALALNMTELFLAVHQHIKNKEIITYVCANIHREDKILDG